MSTKSHSSTTSSNEASQSDIDGGSGGAFEIGNPGLTATGILHDAGGPPQSLIEAINKAESTSQAGLVFNPEDAYDGGRPTSY